MREPEVEGELGERKNAQGQVEGANVDVYVPIGDGLGGPSVEHRDGERVDGGRTGRTGDGGLGVNGRPGHREAMLLGPESLQGGG